MGKYTLKRKGQMNDKDSHWKVIGARVGHERNDGKLLMQCFRFGLDVDGLH